MFALADKPKGATLYLPFDAYDSNGASLTITGLAVTDIEVYKNGSTTQRASDNGYTLLDTDGIDFDGTTGLHGFSIDTNDNSDAGFYVAGGEYWINVNSVTINAQTVRFTYYVRLSAAETVAGTREVRLADVAHGGTASTITFERMIGASTTTNQPAWKMTGNGTAPGQQSTGGASGPGGRYDAGATAGAGLVCTASGNSAGFSTSGSGSGSGYSCTGGATGNGETITGGGTSGDASHYSATLGQAIDLSTASGVAVTITSSDDHGVSITPAANKDALHLTTSGTGRGIAGTASFSIFEVPTLDANLVQVNGTTAPENVAGYLVVDIGKILGDDYPDNTSSLTSAGTTTLCNDTARTEATNSLRGQQIKWITGLNVGLKSTIISNVSGVSFTVGRALPNATANTDQYGFLEVGAVVLEDTPQGSSAMTLTTGAVNHTSTYTIGGNISATGIITAANASNDIRAVNLTTVLNRLGSITGSGVNTILGFFQALFRKSGISAPSDIGGTFDPTTDSVEALADNIPTNVWAVGTRVLTADTNIGSTIADKVWEETLSDHSGTVGSTAAALNAAGSAGDPWNTALPGSYGAGTAGKIIGDNINATISSRLATASYTAPDNASIATILGQTGTTGVLVNASAKTGYSLAAAGLDLVLVESGISAGPGLTNETGTQLTSINARQALSIYCSAEAGVAAGANGSTFTLKPAGKPSGNTRITATVDATGRTAVILKVPD